MKRLTYAIKHEHWDLAAHIIVLQAARSVLNGEVKNGRETKKEKRGSKR
jgi:hypothetical protein